MLLAKMRSGVSKRVDLLPHTIVLLFFVGVLASFHAPVNSAIIRIITINFLPIHTFFELVGILISFGVFTVGWATYQNVRSADILVLSVISFAVGWLDFSHMLSFPGMPDFITPNDQDKAIYFYLASRMTSAFGLLFISLKRPPELKSPWIRFVFLATAIIWCLFWFDLVVFNSELLPKMFIPGVGLTSIKLTIEWIAIAISILSGIFFFRQSMAKNLLSMQWLGCASLLFAMSSFFFTTFLTVSDFQNFSGHLYKAVAFLLLYRAVFTECVKRPYENAKKSAQEALDANSSKSRFLANVSHEFRTPLGVILGFSDLLLESPTLDKDGRLWAESISRNARQFRVLIDDLLDLAKAESEHIRVQLATFDAYKSISEVVNGLQLQAKAKGIYLRLKSDFTGESKIHTDEIRFRQILLNVVGNAVKFTAKGEIHVGAFWREDKLEVWVEDSGIGISQTQIQRLFQPFVQADDPQSRKSGGTGLGLALSKKLCNLLGGDLWIEKSQPGIGSTFVFTVTNQQVSKNTVTEISNEKTCVRPVNLNGFRILAAEDSIDNRILLELYLKPTLATITFANNGSEALTLAESSPFDLILMDIQMPVMDGFEAVTRLRAGGWDGPILALSAHAHMPERERAMHGGFDDYLVKPITRARLWEALAEYSKPVISHANSNKNIENHSGQI